MVSNKIVMIFYTSTFSTNPFQCFKGKGAPVSTVCSFIEFLMILAVPRSSSKCGDRTISEIGPQLGNYLPTHIKNAESLTQFKTLLKTYFFIQVFIATYVYSNILRCLVLLFRCSFYSV